MIGIDPQIVDNEIKTYDNDKPIQQKLQPVEGVRFRLTQQ
jgi:hypothetical protein